MTNSVDRIIKIIENLNLHAVVLKITDSLIFIPYMSPDTPERFGYDIESFNSVLINNPADFISEYDCEYIKKGLLKIIDSTVKYDFNVRVKAKDRSVKTLEGSAVYYGEENGSFYYLVTLSDEIETPEKSTSKVIKDAERLHKAIEFANIATWDYDIKTSRFFNEEDLNTLFDFSFTGMTIPADLIDSGLIDNEEYNSISDFYEKVHSGYRELTRESWFHLPDNKDRFFKIRYIVEFNENNIPVIAHGMLMDLTEQKNAEISFNLRADAFLRNNQDNISTYHVDLSEKTIKSAVTSYAYLKDIEKSDNYDELLLSIADKIPSKTEKIIFLNTFERDNLVSSFDKSIFQIKYEHPIYVKKSHELIARTTADLIKNPASGNIEAVINITDINYGKIMENLIHGTVQREYDYIALVYINSKIFYIIDKYTNELRQENSDFIEYFSTRFKESIHSEDELDFVLSEFNYTNLIEKINTYGEFTLQYNTNDDYEKNRHKILSFAFLNNKRDIITVSCHDTTKLFNDELRQKKKLSNALVEAEKANIAKSEFLSLVSHDIRTPLNGIMGMLELACTSDDINDIRNYLSKASTSSEYLLGLLNDVLDMSKIESGKIELKPEFYEYNEFKEYIEGIILPLCKNNDLKFTMNIEHENQAIFVDKLRFNQIIFNILSNSCKYTKKGGFVDLDIKSELINDYSEILKITIKDNGIGMSEEFQKHMFESFSQEQRPGTETTEGSGLGLSIAYNLVKLMGGEINVESKINKGTTFRISFLLPYKNVDEKVKTGNVIYDEIVRKDYSGKRFLLCEDNEINQEIALQILTSAGATVDIANDGHEAIEKYKKSKSSYYDAIFMDIRMPNIDGLAATREIRRSKKKDSKTIPIIAMTANAMGEDKMECIEAGMNAYIPKPINVSKLYKLMNRIIK